MTLDIEFENLKSYLDEFYGELNANFDDDEMDYILNVDAHIVGFGNIVAFKDVKLSTEFLFSSIKSILTSLIIIKEHYKIKPEYDKYLKHISRRWKI